jgi:transposase
MTPPPPLPDLSGFSHAQKDALIHALWAQVQALTARVSELEARLNEPPKTPDNSSVPPSKGQKGNRPAKVKREGPRKGSLGRTGGGRSLAADPDQFVTAKATACAHCHTALGEGDQVLHGRYDKIDLPPVRPVVTRVERYAGLCPCCGKATLAPVPEGMEEGSPFSPGILATALYLRFVHAISYQRLSRLFEPSSPACAARAWCVRMKQACASTARLAGTGCSRTIRWSSISSARAGLPPSSPR